MFALKRLIFSFLIFFEILFFAQAVSVFLRPRKVFICKTENFDIIFPEECGKTAEILAENADFLYKKAKKTLNSNVNLRMPVIISPDSDEFSVQYTPHPYNRIIIFESFPAFNFQNEKQTVLTDFYREIFTAVLQSERDDFNNFVGNIAGQSYQPVAQLNMPFSFISGFSLLADNLEDFYNDNSFNNADSDFDSDSAPASLSLSVPVFDSDFDDKYCGDFKDSDFLRILIQSKMENKFPNHFQARVKSDVYPYDKIILAAASGFSAYLMQKYGFEKYIELWKESGKLNPFFTDGIFFRVYKKNLSSLWDEFFNAIPVPFDKTKIAESEKNAKEFPLNNSPGLYRNLLFSDYGIIWRDSLRREVDIFKNFSDSDNPFPVRNLLFLADDVENLSLSPDGRFLAVSFTQIKNRENLKKKVCRIFDLQKRKFLPQKFNLKNAATFVAQDSDFYKNVPKSSLYFAAGVNIEDKIPKLQIYSFSDEDKNPVLLFEKTFALDEIPSSVAFTPNGEACVLISKNNRQSLTFVNPKTFKEKSFALEWKNSDDENKNRRFKILNLRTAKISGAKIANNYSDFSIIFDFCLQSEFSFIRAGYIDFSENFEPNGVYFMADDFSGGANSACFSGDFMFYSSQKISNDELKTIEKKYVNFERGNIKKIENFFGEADFKTEIAKTDENFSDNPAIFNNALKIYNPLKYFFPFALRPLLPIRSVSADDGAELWPGLGVTFVSHTDFFENTEFLFSFGYAFAKLDFETGFNFSDDYEKYKEKRKALSRKDKSAAIFFKNSSTPVDVSCGNIFRFNLDGEYFFQNVIGTALQIPLGMNFSNMKIKIESDFTASTDYYDSNLIFQNESLKNWPKFSESYELFEISAESEYSNAHQYGVSPYEKRGFSAGLKLYSMWDLTQIKILNKYKEEQSEQIKINGANYHLTQAQLKESYDERMRAISQINLSAFAKIEIPRLTPLKIVNGWIFSVPASVGAALFDKTGTALQIKTEALLLGKEIHDGFSFLRLYFGRIGLKTGYELNLKYDTAKVLKPDIRRKNYIGEILADVFPDENFYFILNIDFTSSVGFATSSTFSMENKFAFYPRYDGFLFGFNFIARF